MKKTILLLMMLFVTITTAVVAQIPTTLNLQGYLVGTDGKPVDGSVSMEFELFDAATGGQSLHVSNLGSIEVFEGYYNVRIGLPAGVAGIVEACKNPLWFELTVNGVKQGRIPFDAVPYAIGAKYAEKAEWAKPEGPAGGILQGTYPNPDIDVDALKDIISNLNLVIYAIPTGEARGKEIQGKYPDDLVIANRAVQSYHIALNAVRTENLDTGAVSLDRLAKPNNPAQNNIIFWDPNVSGSFKWRYYNVGEVLGGILKDGQIPVWDSEIDGFVASPIEVNGNAISVEELTVHSNTTLEGQLNVTGTSILNNVYFEGNITATTGTTTLGVLNAGNTTLTGLNVTGATILTGATTINNSLNVTGTTTLGVLNAGNTTLTGLNVNGTTTLAGATTINNTLGVTGATTLGVLTAGNTTVNDLNVLGTFSLTNLNLSGNLAVGGTTTLTGATTINNTLGVTGATTLGVLTAGNTTVNDLTVNGAFNLTNLNLSGNLTVGGLTTLNGATTVNAHFLVNDVAEADYVYANEGLWVWGGSPTNLSGDLTVSGTTEVEALTVNGTLTLTNLNLPGTLTVGGATTLNNTLGVTGATTLSNTLAVTGATTLNNNLSVNGMASYLGATSANHYMLAASPDEKTFATVSYLNYRLGSVSGGGSVDLSHLTNFAMPTILDNSGTKEFANSNIYSRSADWGINTNLGYNLMSERYVKTYVEDNILFKGDVFVPTGRVYLGELDVLSGNGSLNIGINDTETGIHLVANNNNSTGDLTGTKGFVVNFASSGTEGVAGYFVTEGYTEPTVAIFQTGTAPALLTQGDVAIQAVGDVVIAGDVEVIGNLNVLGALTGVNFEMITSGALPVTGEQGQIVFYVNTTGTAQTVNGVTVAVNSAKLFIRNGTTWYPVN